MIHSPPETVLAVDIGGTTVKGTLVTHGRMGDEVRLPTRRGPALLDVVVRVAEQLRAKGGPVTAAGVIMPGLVDATRGHSLRAVNLDLADEPITQPLSARLGIPVRLGHDVTTTGRLIARPHLAEDPLAVVIGTGIASVAFARGEVITGRGGQAGEIGHVVAVPDGPRCGCGVRGCLEAVASAAAISRAYAERTGEVVGADVVLARRTEDPAAARVWDGAVRALADGLLAACAVLAPGVVVLGGGFSEAGRPLVDELSGIMRERTQVLTVPEIVATSFGGSAGVHAAAALARGEL